MQGWLLLIYRHTTLQKDLSLFPRSCQHEADRHGKSFETRIGAGRADCIGSPGNPDQTRTATESRSKHVARPNQHALPCSFCGRPPDLARAVKCANGLKTILWHRLQSHASQDNLVADGR